MPAQRQHLAVLYGKFVFAETPAKELVYHFKGLCVAHYRGLGICIYKLIYICRVIRLHMVYYQIIRLPAREGVFQLGEPLLTKMGVYRVHYSDLFVSYHIGVVGHALGDCIQPLKQIDTVIVYANIADIVSYSHSCFLSPAYKISIRYFLYQIMILSQFGPCFNSSVQQIVSGKYHTASILKSIKSQRGFWGLPRY